MKVGVLENVMCDVPFEEALDFFRSSGIEMVEIGCGGTPGIEHCDPEVLLRDEGKLRKFRRAIETAGLGISALSAHGNPVHPVKYVAGKYDAVLRNAVFLAEKLGVDTICTFSGTPGAHDGDVCPNWVTSVWPYDGVAILDYQWRQKLIPYWRNFGRFAAAHGVTKIAFEMHPGFCVSNPETLLRLRENCGEFIGANFDPSHLIWHGIDCPSAIHALAGCIFHFHAKDTLVDWEEMGRNGFFDPSAVFEGTGRPFRFKIPPCGTGELYWRRMVAALRESGYDGVLSIEHEDDAVGQREGIRRSADFLHSILYVEPAARCSWKEAIRNYQREFLPDREEESR
ncbi:MAG: sugar phosphate isomerase/epimerase [Synergistaceae bacterium]|jgi:sugar phosphate isomerase/epimerase|nr:sugar phosphate isomerase/epimerase [Synergistaceae bacterium]